LELSNPQAWQAKTDLSFGGGIIDPPPAGKGKALSGGSFASLAV
jgi:hypothetical protein